VSHWNILNKFTGEDYCGLDLSLRHRPGFQITLHEALRRVNHCFARLVVFVDFDCEFISLKWRIMNPHSAQLKSIKKRSEEWVVLTTFHHFSPFFVTVRIGLSYAGSDAGERRATCGACGAFRLVGRPSWMIFVLQKVFVDMYVFQILSSCFAFKWCTKFMYIILWYLMYRSVINVTF
jgi:hypothetical protein